MEEGQWLRQNPLPGMGRDNGLIGLCWFKNGKLLSKNGVDGLRKLCQIVDRCFRDPNGVQKLPNQLDGE